MNDWVERQTESRGPPPPAPPAANATTTTKPAADGPSTDRAPAKKFWRKIKNQWKIRKPEHLTLEKALCSRSKIIFHTFGPSNLGNLWCISIQKTCWWRSRPCWRSSTLQLWSLFSNFPITFFFSASDHLHFPLFWLIRSFYLDLFGLITCFDPFNDHFFLPIPAIVSILLSLLLLMNFDSLHWSLWSFFFVSDTYPSLSLIYKPSGGLSLPITWDLILQSPSFPSADHFTHLPSLIRVPIIISSCG